MRWTTRFRKRCARAPCPRDGCCREVSTARLQRRVGDTLQVLIDSAPGLGKGRARAKLRRCPGDRRVVRLLPPQKISKTLKVGEFTRAKVVAVEGHDLVCQPI